MASGDLAQALAMLAVAYDRGMVQHQRIAAALDKQAEDPAPELAVDLAEVVLVVNSHTHMSITPDKRARQVNSEPL